MKPLPQGPRPPFTNPEPHPPLPRERHLARTVPKEPNPGKVSYMSVSSALFPPDIRASAFRTPPPLTHKDDDTGNNPSPLNLLRTYVRTTYGPPFVGNHGDTFRRSSLCDLPPQAPAPKIPLRGKIKKIPRCQDSKQLRSSVPRHLFGSADCHRFFPQSFYVGLVMVQYFLLRKHLGTILPISPIPDDTYSAWNWPRRGHLRLPTIYQPRRPPKSVPVAPFGDQRFPILPIPANENHHYQPAPWITPLIFIEDSPNPEGED